MAKAHAIVLEVGILRKKDDEEFDAYSGVYGGEYGFYDEDKSVYIDKFNRHKGTDQAIKDAMKYVTDGVDMTYAIVTDQGFMHYYDGDEEQVIEDMTYDISDVKYSVAKMNGEIVENFLDVVE